MAGLSRIIQLFMTYPLISILAILLVSSLYSNIVLRGVNASLEHTVRDLEAIKPAAEQCSIVVDDLQKECRTEIDDALSKVKPVYIEISHPATGADEFNSWSKEMLK